VESVVLGRSDGVQMLVLWMGGFEGRRGRRKTRRRNDLGLCCFGLLGAMGSTYPCQAGFCTREFRPIVRAIGRGDEVHFAGVLGPVEAGFVGDWAMNHMHCVANAGDFGFVPVVIALEGLDACANHCV